MPKSDFMAKGFVLKHVVEQEVVKHICHHL